MNMRFFAWFLESVSRESVYLQAARISLVVGTLLPSTYRLYVGERLGVGFSTTEDGAGNRHSMLFTTTLGDHSK
jgi:hypothetical protein